MKVLSKNIKSYRTAMKLSQSELARLLGTTLQTISHWETDYTEPSVDQLIALANIFEISIDELVGRTIL